MDTNMGNIPELKEGQVYKIILDRQEKYVTFVRTNHICCDGCIFEDKPSSFCGEPKCILSTRSDRAYGIFQEIRIDIGITEKGWDFVESNLLLNMQPINELQSDLQCKIDRGEKLEDMELISYYRSLAMLCVSAINHYTKM